VSDRSRRRGGDGARALALVAALFVLLAGCGADDDGDEDGDTAATVATPAAPPTETAPAPNAGVRNDEQLIRIAIEGALASGEPAKACGLFVTDDYLTDTYGDRAGCEAAQPGGAAQSVKVSGIAVEGDEATAVAVPSGGPSNGERLEVSLVREGGGWKLDALKSNVPVGP
jgi:hypothetical protein